MWMQKSSFLENQYCTAWLACVRPAAGLSRGLLGVRGRADEALLERLDLSAARVRAPPEQGCQVFARSLCTKWE